MTSVRNMLDAPSVAIGDEVILAGAASLWTVMKFASDLPSTPETKAALEQARTVFLDELRDLGFGQSDIEQYLNRRHWTARAGPLARPPNS